MLNFLIYIRLNQFYSLISKIHFRFVFSSFSNNIFHESINSSLYSTSIQLNKVFSFWLRNKKKMTKCLFKALKAVDLEKHVGLFRSLGYESAGALAHFHTEHFQKLNFTEQELLRLISLLDVLKDSTREGKICPHYFNLSKPTNIQPSTIKSAPQIRASWSDETIQHKNSQSNIKKPITGRSSSISMGSMKNIKNSSNDFLSPRSSTVLSRQHSNTPMKNYTQRFLGPKSFLNKPIVQHIKVKDFNYS